MCAQGVHSDITIFRDRPDLIPTGTYVLGDAAYEGGGDKVRSALKRPAGGFLRRDELLYTTTLQWFRSTVEHTFGYLKRFRIIAGTYRGPTDEDGLRYLNRVWAVIVHASAIHLRSSPKRVVDEMCLKRLDNRLSDIEKAWDAAERRPVPLPPIGSRAVRDAVGKMNDDLPYEPSSGADVVVAEAVPRGAMDMKYVLPPGAAFAGLPMPIVPPLPPIPEPVRRSRRVLPGHARNPAVAYEMFDYDAAERAGYDAIEELSDCDDTAMTEALHLSRALHLSSQK